MNSRAIIVGPRRALGAYPKLLLRRFHDELYEYENIYPSRRIRRDPWCILISDRKSALPSDARTYVEVSRRFLAKEKSVECSLKKLSSSSPFLELYSWHSIWVMGGKTSDKETITKQTNREYVYYTNVHFDWSIQLFEGRETFHFPFPVEMKRYSVFKYKNAYIYIYIYIYICPMYFSLRTSFAYSVLSEAGYHTATWKSCSRTIVAIMLVRGFRGDFNFDLELYVKLPLLSSFSVNMPGSVSDSISLLCHEDQRWKKKYKSVKLARDRTTSIAPIKSRLLLVLCKVIYKKRAAVLWTGAAGSAESGKGVSRADFNHSSLLLSNSKGYWKRSDMPKF